MKPDVLKELNRIASKRGGVLQPHDVVEAARPKASPLHDSFEWDDSEAAQQFRLWQARKLISVVVEVIPKSNTQERVWVSLKSDRVKSGGYRTIVSVLSDSGTREQLLGDALQDLKAFQQKYSRLNELAGVFKSIRKVQLMLGQKE